MNMVRTMFQPVEKVTACVTGGWRDETLLPKRIKPRATIKAFLAV